MGKRTGRTTVYVSEEFGAALEEIMNDENRQDGER